eukprot:TRINITY_DN57731_c0_g1_i1.p1 TRINITY_DN57731_c0_g1~~TRINITY_DN57731_c0_g1_i1.p1  ORF type:complete len:430 (-),score=36.69 TRINITY_DN57731_c0_g1_i1:59-1291(-)
MGGLQSKKDETTVLPQLQESWKVISAFGIDQAAQVFYDEFCKDAEIASKFAGVKMEAQRKMLMTFIAATLTGKISALTVRRIVELHLPLNLTAEHIKQFKAAWAVMLQTVFDKSDAELPDEVISQWNDGFDVLQRFVTHAGYILVAVQDDGSADKAVQYVQERLLRSIDSVWVYSGGPTPAADKVTDIVQNMTEKAAFVKGHLQPEVSGQSPAQGIIDFATRVGADVVALGAHNHTTLQKLMGSSTSRHVFEDSDRSLLVVHPQATIPPQDSIGNRYLVCVSNENSQPGLIGLTKWLTSNDTVVPLHVIPRPQDAEELFFDNETKQEAQTSKRHGGEALVQMAFNTLTKGSPVTQIEGLVVEGVLKTEVVRVAKEKQVHTVVISATRGKMNALATHLLDHTNSFNVWIFQ